MVKCLLCLLLLFAISGCAFLLPTRNLAFQPAACSPKYYRGAFHIHSIFSFDSRATLSKVVRSAERANLDFVIVTDHNTMAGQDAYSAENRTEAPILIFGNEITTANGHLVSLGVNKNPNRTMSSQELINWIHDNKGYAVVAHPLSQKRPWTDWELQGIDGIEVYNFGHVLYAKNKILLASTSLLLWPKAFLNSNIELPKDVLGFWDSLLRTRRVVALGATDAHLKLANIPVMRGMFQQAIRAVTLYVEAEQLTERSILQNLMTGNSFVVFESLGTAPNFLFSAITHTTSYGPGQVISTGSPVTFSVKAPDSDEIRLIANGQIIARTNEESLMHIHNTTGAFRAEVYRKKRIWIISNPIYVDL